jgi:phytol kinase
MNDLIAVLMSFVYVGLVLAVAEGLRARLHLGVEFTRKLVHIGVGMWAWGTAALFADKWFAIIPAAAFVLINYISYRRGLFLAMESSDRRNLGTVYFPIAFVALILFFFSPSLGLSQSLSRALFVAALMPMTWGDAFAAIVGKQWGRHRYTLLGATRSLEGTLTMLTLSFISVWLTLTLLWSNSLFSPSVLLISVLTALLTTVVEALSPFGLDNLLVPAASAVSLLLGVALAGID